MSKTAIIYVDHQLRTVEYYLADGNWLEYDGYLVNNNDDADITILEALLFEPSTENNRIPAWPTLTTREFAKAVRDGALVIQVGVL